MTIERLRERHGLAVGWPSGTDSEGENHDEVRLAIAHGNEGKITLSDYDLIGCWCGAGRYPCDATLLLDVADAAEFAIGALNDPEVLGEHAKARLHAVLATLDKLP